MRHLLFAVLVALPTALVTWMITRGTLGQPGDRCASAPAGAETPAVAAGAGSAAKDPDQALLALFAQPVATFTIIDQASLYDNQGLFNYIDGAAPKYIDRGFRKLAAAEMKEPGGGELTCDVYDMRTAENATAIFRVEATSVGKPVELGDEGRQSTLSLVFRHGPYYVKLTAFDAKAEATLPELARTLLGRM